MFKFTLLSAIGAIASVFLSRSAQASVLELSLPPPEMQGDCPEA